MYKVKVDNKSSAEHLETTNKPTNTTLTMLNRDVKLNYMKMRKKILELLHTEQYDDLKNVILMHKQELENFFSLEGSVILDWAVIYSKNNKSLLFLCQNIPLHLLQTVLRKEGYCVIKSFLQVESSFEGSEFDGPKRQELQQEKFKLLLSIDPKGVPEFMEQNASQDFSSAKIKLNFAGAVSEHKKQHDTPKS
jgi:hypothetical protein